VGQMEFVDLSRRYEGLDRKGDPLQLLAALVPWESFRSPLQKALYQAGLRAKPDVRKSAAGRKPWDEVLIFKALVLQALYNLSDEQTEYQLRDRLSFMRFLGLGLADDVPDATTLWLYREALVKTDTVATLFAKFDNHLREHGYQARGGQIVDATIVEAPKQHNSSAENELIKAGGKPADWPQPKARQKDTDARWTQKNGHSFYGYKNHVSVDRKHKLVRRYKVTSAERHDSQEIANLIDRNNTCRDVWADSAYRSKETEAMLKDAGYRSRIHRRATRGHALSAREKAGNTTRSKVRARVEHAFGHMSTAMRATIVRTIGLARATAKIGMTNLAYNMSRFATLHRMATAPS